MLFASIYAMSHAKSSALRINLKYENVAAKK